MLATVSLQNISNPEYQNEVIEIRGFLHKMPDGEWVLSSLPNVRSCCTGDTQQLVVRGEFDNPSKSKVVMLRGKLIKKDDHYELEETFICGQ